MEVVNQTILVCYNESKIFENDYEFKHDEIENFSISKVDETFPLSSSSFPDITKIHTTGSRSENLFTSNSDEDILYEVGPCLVHKPNEKSIKNEFENNFFIWEETEHFGHYRIEDLRGGYLYPQNLKIEMAPKIKVLRQMKKEEEENSRSAKRNRFGFDNTPYRRKPKTNEDEAKEETKPAINFSFENCDHIVAMRLDQWPESIKNHLEVKLAQNRTIRLEDLLSKYILSD